MLWFEAHVVWLPWCKKKTVCESLWVFSMEGVDPKTHGKLLVQFCNLNKSAGKS